MDGKDLASNTDTEEYENLMTKLTLSGLTERYKKNV
jgi:hypothetical protein